MMWEEIISLAVGNGLWAVLFCVLLCYELKDSRRREGKYADTIKTLGDRLDVVNAVKEDTEKIIDLCAERGKKKAKV